MKYCNRSSFFIVFIQLCACQALSGIDEITIRDEELPLDVGDAEVPDGFDASVAGMGGTGGAAGVGGSTDGGMISTGGVGGGPPVIVCPGAPDVACDLLTDCGCPADQHCQARGAELRPTCVVRGPKPLGSACENADECHSGTCDHNTCRSYCRDGCDGGKCLPLTGVDDKPVAGINVCWMSCQIDRPNSCPTGTTCQIQVTGGTMAAFCLPPANPCPSVWDGVCDEPNLCAAGTDSIDCSCNRSIEGSACDLAQQCGCEEGLACRALGAIGGTPTCARAGQILAGKICESDDECAPGTGCYGSICKQYCENDPACPGEGDECRAVTYRDSAGKYNEVPGVRACLTACDPKVVGSCAADTACAQFETGDFCIWCKPEFEDAACNLTNDCGCEAMPGTSCSLAVTDDDEFTAICASAIGTVADGNVCDQPSDCKSGSVCVSNVCKPYCATNADCDEGVCGGLMAGDQSLPVGICNAPCGGASDPVCAAGTRCTEITIVERASKSETRERDISTCEFVPLTTTCPTTNQRCDEPTPRGTGLCAAGFDAVECASAGAP